MLRDLPLSFGQFPCDWDLFYTLSPVLPDRLSLELSRTFFEFIPSISISNSDSFRMSHFF